jgi:hypothetical protein
MAVPLIPVRQLRRAYNVGAIDDNALIERFKDEGYVDDDIEALQKVYQDDKKKYQESEEKRMYGVQENAFTNSVLKSLELGAINEADAIQALVGVWKDPIKVQYAVNAVSWKKRNDYIRYFLKAVRGEFFLGLYDPAQAKENLKTAGFTDEDATRWVDTWVRQLRMPRRIASTKVVMDWYKRLLITFSDAEKRLSNLGWSATDVILYMAEAEQDLEALQAKQQAALARSEAQKIAAAQRLARQDAAVAAKNAANFRRMFPVAEIEQWYKLKLIDLDQTVELLKGHGFNDDAIRLRIEQWSNPKA